MPNAITASDQFLEQISGQLAVQNELLGKLVGALAPEPDSAPVEDTSAAGEPEVKPAAKKAPAKKAASRKRVTGQ